ISPSVGLPAPLLGRSFLAIIFVSSLLEEETGQSMTIFILASRHANNDATLKERITERFPDDYYFIGRGQWLVAFNGTAQALYSKLISAADQDTLPTPGGIIVFGVGGYYGFASRDMWEWMAIKLRGKSG